MADLDLMDPRRYALATYIMGEARPSKFDEGGRIVLDAELLAKAGISDKAKFVGLGDRFQIWEPRRLRRCAKRCARWPAKASAC
jgi:MraZ protein